MSFEQALNTTLAAAFGDDESLVAELRGAFLGSANKHRRAMAEAADDGDWRDAALRLKGLAASFGATDLMAHAGQAAQSRRDPALLADIDRGIAILSV